MTLRIGTRRSALATSQARTVADALAKATGVPVELVEIVTPGDTSTAPVARLGVGVFVSALRDALTAKEIDAAVHSYKDLPTAPADGLTVAAVPLRADPRDVLVARDGLTLAELPDGSRIGTGAPRRVAQLRALGRGLEPVPLRGNVDTRLRRVADGDLDAVVLARAGLLRLGRAEVATEILDPAVMLPAPAQGALAVECRLEDTDLVDMLAVLDHPDTRAAVTAERALLSTLEAGCSAPVAGLAEADGPGRLRLSGAVVSPDGRRGIRLVRGAEVPAGATALTSAERLGRELAADLLDAGADKILERS
ncbi:MAG TPA: hydroxymethylbilane synthase [Natronosporangium sp.]|nr:hydroxymethylbilane synthase [Natronosporangium sp.]